LKYVDRERIIGHCKGQLGDGGECSECAVGQSTGLPSWKMQRKAEIDIIVFQRADSASVVPGEQLVVKSGMSLGSSEM
jgi:hypothetical protein